MARLNWVRLDSDFYSNPKFLILRADRKYRAIFAYMAGLGWSGSQGQFGYIPFYALESFGATKRDATDLIDAGLWAPARGGYDIHDWSEHQPSAFASEKRSRDARDAAHKRWDKVRSGGV